MLWRCEEMQREMAKATEPVRALFGLAMTVIRSRGSGGALTFLLCAHRCPTEAVMLMTEYTEVHRRTARKFSKESAKILKKAVNWPNSIETASQSFGGNELDRKSLLLPKRLIL